MVWSCVVLVVEKLQAEVRTVREFHPPMRTHQYMAPGTLDTRTDIIQV